MKKKVKVPKEIREEVRLLKKMNKVVKKHYPKGFPESKEVLNRSNSLRLLRDSEMGCD
jgi:hypothetical protein